MHAPIPGQANPWNVSARMSRDRCASPFNKQFVVTCTANDSFNNLLGSCIPKIANELSRWNSTHFFIVTAELNIHFHECTAACASIRLSVILWPAHHFITDFTPASQLLWNISAKSWHFLSILWTTCLTALDTRINHGFWWQSTGRLRAGLLKKVP